MGERFAPRRQLVLLRRSSVGQIAGATCECPLNQVLLVERLLTCLNGRLPTLVNERAVEAP